MRFPAHSLTIAVARDAAFVFVCRQPRLPAVNGPSWLIFSPLAENSLDQDASFRPAVTLNCMLKTLRQHGYVASPHVQAGKPVWAECGGS
jgi:cobyrinic acid a,c-diamide synthase